MREEKLLLNYAIQRKTPTNTSLVCSSVRLNLELRTLINFKGHNLYMHCRRENDLLGGCQYV